ncbi:diacylglycerol kinase family protein [Alteromonas sp. H39]|uniref:diacylglycerol kinase family protein n=1 Tax=Alteromonas sp. H39 TaxID=3389876 RepID=UPI0039E0DEE5
MKMVKWYVLGAIIAGLLTWFVPVWLLKILFGWTCFSLIAVSSAYLLNYPELFRKREDGSIPVYIRWVFVPFLLGTGAYNSWARKTDKVPAIQKIDEQLYLACRLSGSDIETLTEYGVDAILDVTAEFDGLDWTAYQWDCEYLNIPVLDHTSPSPEQLNTAINWIDQQLKNNHKVVVHCALGRGRSVLVMAAYLLARDETLSVVDALNRIQSVRETARLNKHQLSSLRKVKQGGRLRLTDSLALIANPVAGGGKWKEEKNDILSQLNPHFRVTVYETTESVSAEQLASKAVNQGADIVVACGGDGTITEVARALEGTKATLGLIPLGTANALSQVLHGYSSKLMPVSTACDIIVDGHSTAIDTAICNDKLMLLVAALGFEQQMISSADRDEKNAGGQFAYLRGLWDAISKNEAQEFEVQFEDDDPVTLHSPSLVIANAAPLTTALAQGGDIPSVTDGKLDITWLEPQESSETQFLSLAELVFLSSDAKKSSDRIRHKQAKSIRITLPREMEYALDGEIHCADSLTINTVPKNLNVFISKDSDAVDN